MGAKSEEDLHRVHHRAVLVRDQPAEATQQHPDWAHLLCFQGWAGVLPDWEDEDNVEGGRWMISCLKVDREHKQARHNVAGNSFHAGRGTLGGVLWVGQPGLGLRQEER